MGYKFDHYGVRKATSLVCVNAQNAYQIKSAVCRQAKAGASAAAGSEQTKSRGLFEPKMRQK